MLQSRKSETQSTRSSMFGASAARKLPARETSTRCCYSIALAPPSSPVASRRCPSPSFNRNARPQTPSSDKRSSSAERKRPTTPSSPTLSPASPWRLSSRPCTPVDDAVKAVHHFTRRLSNGRKPEGPWPAMRSLSASFQLECASDAQAKKPAQDHKLRPSSVLRGKNCSTGPENSKPVENSHLRLKKQNEINQRLCVKNSGKQGREIAATGSPKSPNFRERISVRLLQRPASPRKTPLPVSSPVRPASPLPVSSPVRPASPLPSKNNYATPTISSASMSRNLDAPQKRKNFTPSGDDFKLRMLHNRYLQWLFLNSRTRASMLIQKKKSERVLYGVCAATWKMRESIVLKGIHILRLKLEMRLTSILNRQMRHLEEWESMEREHYCSLSEATDVLRVTTLPLPVVSGAKAEVNALKAAISSAVDVLQSMGSPLRHLLSRLEGANSLMSELTQLTKEEKATLDECRQLLSSTAALWNGGCIFLLNWLRLSLLDHQFVGNHDDEHIPVVEVFALFCPQFPDIFLKFLEQFNGHVLEIILSPLQVYYHLHLISIFEKSLCRL